MQRLQCPSLVVLDSNCSLWEAGPHKDHMETVDCDQYDACVFMNTDQCCLVRLNKRQTSGTGAQSFIAPKCARPVFPAADAAAVGVHRHTIE